mmetsp:Transcript_42812/g.106572  ORF Transcript_42812/g.106572 Transcript_42812/m.106572 type:complete len:232 (+) Transcript_42812:716-1411(+)
MIATKIERRTSVFIRCARASSRRVSSLEAAPSLSRSALLRFAPSLFPVERPAHAEPTIHHRPVTSASTSSAHRTLNGGGSVPPEVAAIWRSVFCIRARGPSASSRALCLLFFSSTSIDTNTRARALCPPSEVADLACTCSTISLSAVASSARSWPPTVRRSVVRISSSASPNPSTSMRTRSKMSAQCTERRLYSCARKSAALPQAWCCCEPAVRAFRSSFSKASTTASTKK